MRCLVRSMEFVDCGNVHLSEWMVSLTGDVVPIRVRHDGVVRCQVVVVGGFLRCVLPRVLQTENVTELVSEQVPRHVTSLEIVSLVVEQHFRSALLLVANDGSLDVVVFFPTEVSSTNHNVCVFATFDLSDGDVDFSKNVSDVFNKVVIDLTEQVTQSWLNPDGEIAICKVTICHVGQNVVSDECVVTEVATSIAHQRVPHSSRSS